ncbi:TMEM143 family protein [Oxynema aestuarii]|jgi:hypothetical protein|uniref:DUF3754 domain-containing protein n=1 Tax=Oxynema aestuarii AP17 TaxID=2064643 RepID=A0A6H1U3I7_9CYAN|nr:TMEM143 family protein [Oxynema aestuarii]QIZ73432.1 DUF3754 domain-containing protein [Oxynema aestuarii AP17]RMH76398.1 MAG: DUF3754 domain-containing protein [Cyanobacteria bacterium J007]
MATYEDREAFIPYRRTDLIELCLQDGQLPEGDRQKFREFCTILTAYYHFELHQLLERLKDRFAPFNPDADTKFIDSPDAAQLKEMEYGLVEDLKTLLKRANYVPLSPESLQRAFREKSLIELQTDVDFDDFDQMVCYCRGDIYKMATIRQLFRSVQKTIDIFERVVLLLKFKDEDYFIRKKRRPEKLNFEPGKMYVYYYKNIPKFDLEFLFPNVKISMTWKDRILLAVPAIGAAIPLILKVLPHLLLIVTLILLLVGGLPGLEHLKPNDRQLQDVMPVLVAVLSLAIAFGGFAFKQYNSYKNKKIKFQKNVTDTLFFRNMASNLSVFQALIDVAEEEECKEIILVYYHLLTSEKPLTPEALDDRIEEWMEKNFETKIDFDINGPLDNLSGLHAQLTPEGEIDGESQEVSLLRYDRAGCCHVLPLDRAKAAIDWIWDNAFVY